MFIVAVKDIKHKSIRKRRKQYIECESSIRDRFIINDGVYAITDLMEDAK